MSTSRTIYEWLRHHGVLSVSDKIVYKITLARRKNRFSRIAARKPFSARLPKEEFHTFLNATGEDIRRLESYYLTSDQKTEIVSQADKVLEEIIFVHGHGFVPKDDPAVPGRIRNRMDHLIPVIQAYHLTEDDKYKHYLIETLDTWLEKFSPKEFDGIEKPIDTAIRLLNWTWVFKYFKSEINWTTNHRLHEAIYYQMEYVKSRLSPGGNHLVLEALVLFCVGSLYKDDYAMKAWSDLGRELLEQEIILETSEEGLHSEQSMFYHQVVATHFLKAYQLAEQHQQPFSPEYIQRLELMLNYVGQSIKPDLTHPMYGDGDLLTSLDREHQEAGVLITALSAIFCKPYNEAFVRERNALSLWFFGRKIEDILAESSIPESKIYPQSGIAVLKHENNYLFLDAAPFGDPRFPHHGHADALNYELVLAGINLIVDPGGYAYLDSPERHYARSSFGHNVVLINNEPQSTTFGVFGHGRLTKPILNNSKLNKSHDYLRASHNGYSPAVHHREVYFDKTDKSYVLIIDYLSGCKTGDLLSSLIHLAPNIHFTGQKLKDLKGRKEFYCQFTSNHKLEVEHIAGGAVKGQLMGLYFPHDYQSEHAEIVRIDTRYEETTVFITLISEHSIDIRLVDNDLLLGNESLTLNSYHLDFERCLSSRNSFNH